MRELIKQKHGYPAEMTEEEYDRKLTRIAEGFEGYLKWDESNLSILKFEGEPDDGPQDKPQDKPDGKYDGKPHNKHEESFEEKLLSLSVEEREFTKESIEEYERVKEETFSKLSESFKLLEELFPSLWD